MKWDYLVTYIDVDIKSSRFLSVDSKLVHSFEELDEWINSDENRVFIFGIRKQPAYKVPNSAFSLLEIENMLFEKLKKGASFTLADVYEELGYIPWYNNYTKAKSIVFSKKSNFENFMKGEKDV